MLLYKHSLRKAVSKLPVILIISPTYHVHISCSEVEKLLASGRLTDSTCLPFCWIRLCGLPVLLDRTLSLCCVSLLSFYCGRAFQEGFWFQSASFVLVVALMFGLYVCYPRSALHQDPDLVDRVKERGGRTDPYHCVTYSLLWFACRMRTDSCEGAIVSHSGSILTAVAPTAVEARWPVVICHSKRNPQNGTRYLLFTLWLRVFLRWVDSLAQTRTSLERTISIFECPGHATLRPVCVAPSSVSIILPR